MEKWLRGMLRNRRQRHMCLGLTGAALIGSLLPQPLFCDITWGAGGSTADLTLDIASKMQNEVRPVLPPR